MDENTDGLAPLDTSIRRKQIPYDVLFSGGNIEWYFGYNPLPLGGDVNAGDFRQRETMWDQMRFAREMMQAELPFWRMEPQDSLLNADSDRYGGAEVFAAGAEVYAVYLPATNGVEWLNLQGVDGVYQLRWFDPRSGQVTNGRTNIAGNSKVQLGMPPSQLGQDWVALVSRIDMEINVDASNARDAIVLLPDKNGPHFVKIPSPIVTIGETYQWILNAKDTKGINPSVTAGSLSAGMQLNGYGNGQLEVNWTVPESMPSEVVIELIAIRAGDTSARTTTPMIIRSASIAGQLNSDESDQYAPNGLDAVGFKPALRFIPNIKVTVGQTLIHRVEADSLNGFPPSLNVWDSPDDAQFLDNGDGTRTFYWTPSLSDVGLRTVTFAARYEQNSDMLDTVSVEIQITPQGSRLLSRSLRK
ncbi:MAG: hypothetical protein ACJAUZ_001927 [Flavobacteriaceae bacterium]|jgi:hypothetical protein